MVCSFAAACWPSTAVRSPGDRRGGAPAHAPVQGTARERSPALVGDPLLRTLPLALAAVCGDAARPRHLTRPAGRARTAPFGVAGHRRAVLPLHRGAGSQRKAEYAAIDTHSACPGEPPSLSFVQLAVVGCSLGLWFATQAFVSAKPPSRPSTADPRGDGRARREPDRTAATVRRSQRRRTPEQCACRSHQRRRRQRACAQGAHLRRLRGAGRIALPAGRPGHRGGDRLGDRPYQ